MRRTRVYVDNSVISGTQDEALEQVAIDDDVRALAYAYISAGVLTRKRRSDAFHVAAASVAGADLVVSWNFKHLVNYDRIRKFNAVNLMNGYRPLDIRSPKEVAYGGEGQDV